MIKIIIAYSCPILMKLECFGQIFERYSNIKFYKNQSSGSRVVPCGHDEIYGIFAVLRTRLKTKALMIIKSGKYSRATYHVNYEKVQRFVHLLCLRHQQIWYVQQRRTADFWLFTDLKKHFKGNHFIGREEIISRKP
jgi:hypothetical protein